MTRISAFPSCSYRYGRSDIFEKDDGRKTARLVICCGLTDVEPEDCIMCGGFTNANCKFEFGIVSFIKASKDLRFKPKKFS